MSIRQIRPRFIETRNRVFRVSVLDEYSRECLAIDVARRLTSEDVLERLTDLFIRRGVPDYIRSDNGAEFAAHVVRDWLQCLRVYPEIIRRVFWGIKRLGIGSRGRRAVPVVGA